eukprot:5509201-Prymnesium_polylepis.1
MLTRRARTHALTRVALAHRCGCLHVPAEFWVHQANALAWARANRPGTHVCTRGRGRTSSLMIRASCVLDFSPVSGRADQRRVRVKSKLSQRDERRRDST